MTAQENLSLFLKTSSSIYYITTGVDGKFTYANQLFLMIFGYEKNDILGKPFSEGIYEEDISAYDEACNQCLSVPGKSVTVDIRKPRYDGSLFWTRWEFCALVDDTGKAEGLQGIGNNITERKRAERETIQARENLELILNNTTESFILIDKELKILGFNQSANTNAMDLYGFRLKKGMPVLKLEKAGNHKAVTELYQKVFAGKEYNTEVRFKSKTSGEIIYSNHFKPVYNERNEIYVVIVTSRDVTEKKLAEEKLISNEKHFRALIENSTDGITVISPNGKLLDISPSGKKILGYDSKSVEDGIRPELVHPDDLGLLTNTIKEIVNQPDSIKTIEYRIRTNGVGYKWISGTYHNLLHESSIGGIVQNFRDITKRKEAERALQVSEERYRLLFYYNPQPMWIYEIETLRFLEVNETTIKHYGYSREEFRKMTIRDIRPESELPILGDWLKKMASSDTPIQGHAVWSHRKKNGQVIFVEIKSHNLEFNGRDARLVLANDVTEKVHAEERLVLSNQRFEYAAKATSDIIWEWDIVEDSLYLGDAFKSVLGWDISSTRKFKEWRENIHPADKAEAFASFDEALKNPSKESWEHEYRYLKASGEYAYVVDRAWIVRNSKGTPIKLVGAIRDISERKKNEEDLLKSNERFIIAGKATADAIWDWNLITDEIFWGEGFKTLFGYDAEEQQLNSNSWTAHIHPDDKEKVIHGIHDAIQNRNENSWTAEYRYVKANGEYANVIDRGIVMRDESGKPYRMIGAMQDITERKEAELKLVRERYLLRILIDHLPDYIYVKDVQLKHIINNRANVELIGATSEEETIGKTVVDYFGTTIAEQYIEKDLNVLRSGVAVNNLEESIITRKGEMRWLLTTKVPLKDENNNVIGLVGISRDITERKKIEESLRKSNERYDIVAKATNDAIWDWNLVSNVVVWNEAVVSLFGFSYEDVTRDPAWWDNHIHPEDRERVLEKINYQRNHGIINWQDEYRFICADGSYKYVFDRGFILFNEENQPYRMIGAMMDTTQRRELEDELAMQKIARQRQITEATIQAQEKERSEIGRELHDNINQILTTTKLYIDMAMNETDIKEELLQKSYMNVSSAIEEIRSLSRSLVPPSLGDIGLKEAVAEMIGNLNIAQGLRIKLRTSGLTDVFIPGTLKLMAFRIVQEHVNNILKHSKATEAEIKIGIAKTVMTITITDNGIGFDPKKKTKGIGLSNITSRAELYNGKVEIITSPGKGCVLKVIMPV